MKKKEWKNPLCFAYNTLIVSTSDFSDISSRNGCPEYENKLNLIVRLLFWGYGYNRIPFHWITRCFTLTLMSVVFWPSTPPNMPFQRRRKCIFHWCGWVLLTIWDKVKSSGTVIDWCTGREWSVNCMTVISARWKSNMPFQGQRKWHIPIDSHGEILRGRLNYYITQWRQEISEF